MRSLFFLICVLGAFSCAAAFRDEWRMGKLYPSLLIASIGWTVGAISALVFWRD